MKKMIFSFVAVLAMTIALVSWKSSKVTSAAVVISDFRCGLIDGDGHEAIVDASHSVVTSSGNSIFKCSGRVPNSSHRTVKWNADNDPFPGSGDCLTLAGATSDWQEVVSASGQATVTCKLK